MDFKKLLNEDARKILTEDSLNAIEEAFNQKVELSVNAALDQQDEIYAEKLQGLVKKIDVNHTGKLKKLVEALDKNNASKLMKVVKLFQRDSGKQAATFKKQLVESIDNYLDVYLEEVVSAKDFSQAVKNNNAYKILEKLRGALAVDSVMMKESVRGAVLDGQSKIENYKKENAELKKQLKSINETVETLKVKMLLEDKTSSLPDRQKNFVRKALQDKSLSFIQENFDYTLNLFKKQEKDKLVTLKEEAIKQRNVKPDVVPTQKVVQEKVNTNTEHGDMYLEELSKTWATKK